MRIGKRCVLALVLTSRGFAGCAPDAPQPIESIRSAPQALETSSAWTSAAVMLAKRTAHASFKLADGRVLVVGGTENPSEAAELYDADKNTWSRITLPSDVVIPGDIQCRPALAQLASGLVLVVSDKTVWSFDLKTKWTTYNLPVSTCTPNAIALTGEKALIWVNTDMGDAFIYDSGTITPTLPMPSPMQGNWLDAAVLRLNDGRVLISGGHGENTNAVLYDDADPNSWIPAGNMFFGRFGHAVALLPNGNVLAAGGNASGPFPGAWNDTVEVFDVATSTWAPTTKMLTYRDGLPTATQLPSGFVLVIGGSASSTAELFDPGIQQWSPLESLNDDRYIRHASTLLDDGRVLVTGGVYLGSTSEASICDALAFAWEQCKHLPAEDRAFHSATKLDDRTMLVVGGNSSVDGPGKQEAWIYDEGLEGQSEESWSAAKPPLAAHVLHTATKLDDGRVLVVGGTESSFAEIFDPSTSTNPWTAVAALPESVSGASATLLPKDEDVPSSKEQVLHVGGFSKNADGSYRTITSIYLYDPATDTWTTGPSLPGGIAGGIGHSATLLADGSVLVVGGLAECPSPSTPALARSVASRYYPATNTWEKVSAMNQARAFHSATLLADGRVIVAGGGGEIAKSCVDPTWTSIHTSTEIYNPTANTWTPAGNMNESRTEHQAILLDNGRVLVAGGRRNTMGRTLASAEVFDPLAKIWTATSRMQIARYGHSLTSLSRGLVVVGRYRPFSSSAEENSPVERFPQAAAGGRCIFDDQCKSTVCSDGICCDRVCDSPCLACSKAANENKKLADGVCEDISGCAPYACALESGVCVEKGSCGSIDDCATGYVCDPTGACIEPVPNASTSDETSCAASAVDSNASPWASIALVAGAYALRRRRHQRKS